VLVALCVVGTPLLFFGRILSSTGSPGAPPNDSNEVRVDPGFAASGDRVAYLVRVVFSGSTPPDTEGLVEVDTDRQVTSGPTVVITPQAPGQPSLTTVGVGESSSGSSTSTQRSAILRGFRACAGCDLRFAVSAVAGSSSDVDLEFQATAVGFDASQAGARPTVSVERLGLEPPSSSAPRLDLPEADATGVLFRLHHVTVEGDLSGLGSTRAVLRADGARSGVQVPAPTLYRARPGDQTVVAVPEATPLPLTPQSSCTAPCRVGLWVVLPDGGNARVELVGPDAGALELSTDPVRASATEQEVAVRAGTQRTVEVRRDDRADVDGFLAVGQRVSGGPLVRSVVGDQRGEVSGGDQSRLTPGAPCVDARCATPIEVRFDPSAPNTVTLAAEAYSVAPDAPVERPLLIPSITGG
jgi:hypothetical protein